MPAAPSNGSPHWSRHLPLAAGLAAIAACFAMIDLKGISTDEGMRLSIVNGGQPFTPDHPRQWATYRDVLFSVEPHAYQPGFYLFLNTLMRLFERQDLLFFRLVNIGFLALCLRGLLVLSRDWKTWPRTFLVVLFAFNAYAFMHVLQIREYVAAMAFYIWSTWAVLRLDQRVLRDEWADAAIFLGHGLLLTGAFYLQTWTVFPALAQGAFLVLRRRPQFWRFLAHLGFSALVVFSLTWPYLRANTQKVDIGLWAREKVTLLGQLSNGFHLVLAGHPSGQDPLSAVLPYAWLAILALGGWLVWRRRPQLPATLVDGSLREAWLMALSMVVPLAFQIVYFYKVEPLSVWPRYFIIHYFFLTWLIALAFRLLHAAPGFPLRRPVLLIATLLLGVSAVYQVRSYWRDPYFDTSTTAASNWPAVASAVHANLRPDDIVFCYDFIVRSTLTATRPFPNRALLLAELESSDPGGAPRLLFLENTGQVHLRAGIAARMSARGYPFMEILPVAAGDGSGPLSDWHILAFSRR
jgi:hypothetical protein